MTEIIVLRDLQINAD